MKKFYFYLKYILEILILFLPLPSLFFCLFPLLSFLLCPPRPSAVRCKSYAHSFGYSLQFHFFEAFAFSVLFASWLLPYFLFLALSKMAHFFISPLRLEAPEGKEPPGDVGGGSSISSPFIKFESGHGDRAPPPPAPPGAGHSSLMAFFQYCFSLFLT